MWITNFIICECDWENLDFSFAALNTSLHETLKSEEYCDPKILYSQLYFVCEPKQIYCQMHKFLEQK